MEVSVEASFWTCKTMLGVGTPDWTDKQINIQTNKQTNKQANKQTILTINDLRFLHDHLDM